MRLGKSVCELPVVYRPDEHDDEYDDYEDYDVEPEPADESDYAQAANDYERMLGLR